MILSPMSSSTPTISRSRTSARLALLLLLAIPSCHAFAADSQKLRASGNANIFIKLLKYNEVMPNTTIIMDKIQEASTSISEASSSFVSQASSKLPKRTLEFPSLPMEYPSSLIQTSHEQYLRRHQIVKKRRVFRRSLEIAHILSGEILRPLLCALVKSQPKLDMTKLMAQTMAGDNVDEEWDAFWSQQCRENSDLTNAQRIAKGVPALGPTFVKLAHILATRPDILHVPLAQALGELQDKGVAPFDNLTAKRIIRNEIKQKISLLKFKKQQEKSKKNSFEYIESEEEDETSTPKHYIQDYDDLQQFMDSLSDLPIAAASVAQVYKADLPGYGPVAVKVLRPGIRAKVERDATLFHSVATWMECWNSNALRKVPLVGSKMQVNVNIGRMHLVEAVDEFTSRVLEDMDFTREAENMKVFAQLYDSQRGTSPTVKVVVPEVIPELCSDRILVMEWLEGTKLTEICQDCCGMEAVKEVEENLQLIVQAIECTISQLIDHGLLHGDPHSANLLKVKQRHATLVDNPSKIGKWKFWRRGNQYKPELGYLDFGLVSYVPQKFRDGIVCAVVQLVFARNIDAVADLCEDLGLLPQHALQDAKERRRFLKALQSTTDQILLWPTDSKGIHTEVPKVRFDNLLPAVTKLIGSFEFTVPPYFLNNIRALATLESMALKLDPKFNVLRVIYPYSINRLMRNPSVSQRVQETFVDICRSPETKLISPKRVHMLLNDWAQWTGYRKRKVFWDLLTSAGGRRVGPVIVRNWYLNRVRNVSTLFRICRQVVARGYYEMEEIFRDVSVFQRIRQASY